MTTSDAERPRPRLSFTLDLEDHRADRRGPARYEANTHVLLDLFEALGVRLTVFIVAEIAREAPALVREVAARGHEPACHSLAHRPLDQETPERFRRETAEAKAAIEDAAGRTVVGYRAPVFSLTAKTAWAAAELGGLGFEYSSSVLPAASPLYGFPEAPRTPFRWGVGPLELPAPVARFGLSATPFLGGFYLRYLPGFAVRRALRRQPRSACLWSYVHPYDIDATEPFGAVAGAPLWVSLLLWANRAGTRRRLERLVRAVQPEVPLGERVRAGAFADAPTFTPS
ncbi:MAG: polysaccharide deacetylase family protein [Alphaproteobacteria bacterium]|nr:polysaccharide deacetylase family protein [Alphaproteobacteria bacterium]